MISTDIETIIPDELVITSLAVLFQFIGGDFCQPSLCKNCWHSYLWKVFLCYNFLMSCSRFLQETLLSTCTKWSLMMQSGMPSNGIVIEITSSYTLMTNLSEISQLLVQTFHLILEIMELQTSISVDCQVGVIILFDALRCKPLV